MEARVAGLEQVAKGTREVLVGVRGDMHALGMDATWTVHAPQVAWLQPTFDPVSPRRSRSASSRVVRGSSANWRSRPSARSVAG